LITAGLIGAAPMILYSIFAFFRWLVTRVGSDPDVKRIAEMGLLATCLGFVKSFTTNGISTFDVSLIIFLFGVVAQTYVVSHALAARSENEYLSVNEPSLAAHLN
jgi:O-antigen ligase